MTAAVAASGISPAGGGVGAAVTMYVYNDVTVDSRVRREAAALARAGYRVTVMGIARDNAATTTETEDVGGYRIVRLPTASTWRRRWLHLARPRVLGREGLVLLRRSLGRPGSWQQIPKALAMVALAAALEGLRLVYGGLAGAARRLTGRSGPAPWPPESVYWLVTWRWAILDWCARAAELAPASAIHHGHDLTALPAALAASRRDAAVLVYDSHEIFADSGANVDRPWWARALLRAWERRWARSAAALVTVNHAYARVIAGRIRPRRTVVVHNCPERWDPPDGAAANLRAAARVPDGSPIVLYHGAFNRHRGIEQLAEAMLAPGLERAHLVFLGYGSGRALVDQLVADERFRGRLHVLDAVPPDTLLGMVTGADVDAIPLQRSSLNHWLCTPNKLFESLTAGVPVVVSDFPVMRGIVLDDPGGPLGAVCAPADPASIADAIAAILDLPPAGREALRSRCRAAARERWNWETESVGLLDLYADLVVRRSGGEGETARTR